MRLWAGPEGTRLVLDLTAPVEFDVFTLDNPYRVVVDLAGTRLATARDLPNGQGPVKKVRAGPQAGNGLRLVLDMESAQQARSFIVAPDGAAGHRLVVELPGTAAPPAILPPASGVRLSLAVPQATVDCTVAVCDGDSTHHS